VGVPESQPAPLRRSRSGAVLGGVCAGLAPRLGVDPLVLRVGFVVASAAGGIGIGLYLICWVLIPAGHDAPTERGRVRGALGRRESWQVGAGIGLLVLSVLLLFRAWGIWVGDAVVWPLVLASGGGALIWRQSQSTEVVERPAREQARPGGGAGRTRRLRLSRPSPAIVALGAALVVGAGLVFLWLNGALVPNRDVTLAVLVVIVALGLILIPWWLRLGRGLTEERAERIRTQERAEMAAHLHDSVLQTLALMQKRAGDPREVAALARRQERELRTWLNGGPRRGRVGADSLAAALEEAVAEIEDAHGVPVDVVAVGDRPLDERSRALVAAAREAVLNAVKFAPDAAISVYAEVRGDRAEVFVRDRGPGFDLAAVPPDRRGLRESVLGRMERHGGQAAVHTRPGEGTEVELVIDGG
jgi:signal transduction histidine kinase/phage shock protein PspC (stress-responsive transcriptional regulator)